MRKHFVVALLLLPLLLSGCAVAFTAVITAYDVVTSAISVGQKHQAQDTAEENLDELKGLRADLRRSGFTKPDVLSTAEAARDQEIANAEKPRPRPSLWERIKRMVP